MLVVNTESITGYEIETVCGIVQGNTVRAKHIGRDIAAAFKNIAGGEIRAYTQLINEARHEAVRRMLDQAEYLGANAVVNVRFSTSAITQQAAELFVYGTAVQVKAVGNTAAPEEFEGAKAFREDYLSDVNVGRAAGS